MPKRRVVLALLCVAAAPLPGQTSPRYAELGAFYALIYTPVGALPSIARVRTPRDSASRGVADIRYGRYKYRNSDRTFNNVGLSGQWRVFRGVRLGATWAYRSCGGGCNGLSMGSIDVGTTLLRRTATEPGSGDTELGIDVSAGIGKPAKDAFSTRSVAVMIPMTVTLPQPNDGLLSLSLLPGAGWGRLQDDAGVIFASIDSAGGSVPGPIGSFSTTRPIVGASIAYFFPIGLGVHASVHRIAVEESTTQSGLVISWRF